MWERIAADAVVLIHFSFIAFVTVGGLLVFRWRVLAWLHVPAVVWGALIEFMGWICPLTPLENRLRLAGGEQSYAKGFVHHYLVPLVYPTGLSREVQFGLGIAVVVINVIVYAIVVMGWARVRRHKAQQGRSRKNCEGRRSGK